MARHEAAGKRELTRRGARPREAADLESVGALIRDPSAQLVEYLPEVKGFDLFVVPVGSARESQTLGIETPGVVDGVCKNSRFSPKSNLNQGLVTA